jgi:hypothetical protein
VVGVVDPIENTSEANILKICAASIVFAKNGMRLDPALLIRQVCGAQTIPSRKLGGGRPKFAWIAKIH